MYRLFDDLAHRYDLHTPPDHYRHDHAFVLKQAAALGNPCRLLDVGCGTGVLIEKAQKAGVAARGIDASPGMIRVAQARAGEAAAALRRMQDIDEEAAYDMIVALSWTLNYCEGHDDLLNVLRRMRRALRPGGRVLLQVAHAPNVSGEVLEDREPGPTGIPDDVVFRYRFVRIDGDDLPMFVDYGYVCTSTGEALHEQHILRMTDVHAVAECVREAGFDEVDIYDSWRCDPLQTSPDPFVSAIRRPGP